MRRKVRLSTIERTQNGPSYNSSAAMYPEKSARTASRYSPVIRCSAFFPRPQPNSESWQKARRRADLSRGANWPRGKPKRQGGAECGAVHARKRSYRPGGAERNPPHSRGIRGLTILCKGPSGGGGPRPSAWSDIERKANRTRVLRQSR